MVAKYRYVADAIVSFIFMAACIVPISLADSILKPLNMSEVAWTGPEGMDRYLGSPSVVRLSDGSLLATVDFEGDHFGSKNTTNARVFTSPDNGETWLHVTNIPQMAWGTLFNVDNKVGAYTRKSGQLTTMIIGTSSRDTTVGGVGARPRVSITSDGGRTWSSGGLLSDPNITYSTGPTPVVEFRGRVYRSMERNLGPCWGSDYGISIFSNDNTVEALQNVSAWQEIRGPRFDPSTVPTEWKSRSPGWLESNVVIAENGSIYSIARVNSLPVANKASLTYMGPDAPRFIKYIDFPGGMSKFSIRYDDVSGKYVSLTNFVGNDSVVGNPACASVFSERSEEASPSNKHCTLNPEGTNCCSNSDLYTCIDPFCKWCLASTRSTLALITSDDLLEWNVQATVIEDDTGMPSWAKKIFTGFQYVDWHFDDEDGKDLILVVRSAYRGASFGTQSNRILFGIVNDWRSYVN